MRWQLGKSINDDVYLERFAPIIGVNLSFALAD